LEPRAPERNPQRAGSRSYKITVGDLAVITVDASPNTKHEKRQSVDAERSTLLESIDVPTSAEARALLSKRRDLEANRKAVLTELKTLKVTGDPALVIAKPRAMLLRRQTRQSLLRWPTPSVKPSR